MSISITDYLKIDKKKFDKTGAFDAILNVDSCFFIDPHLLKGCSSPFFKNSYNNVEKRFRNILFVLKKSKVKNDVFWRRAESFFDFPEIKGLCIGYSNSSTSGSAIGPTLRNNLLETAKSIIDVGVEEPEIFELVGLFEKNIGPDRISDITANIIYDDIVSYTENIWNKLKVKTESRKIKEKIYQVVENPYNHSPILILPKEILRDLPIAFDWSDIDRICSFNEELRNKVNSTIGDTWKKAVKVKKQELKSLIIEEPGLMIDLIDLYRKKPAEKYDFEEDKSGQIIWYEESKKYTKKFPLSINNNLKTDVELKNFIISICEKFKDLVENNGLSSLLYESTKKPKKEEASQKLFFGIADAYCQAHDVDISREVNGGRGPVDFKFSTGYNKRVVVEAKLTTNNQLLHGFDTQIEEYQKAEKTKEAIYLVIDVGGSRKRLDDLLSKEATWKKQKLKTPTIFYIDAKPKKSASVYTKLIPIDPLN